MVIVRDAIPMDGDIMDIDGEIIAITGDTMKGVTWYMDREFYLLGKLPLTEC